jgi:hypothetical protein
MKTWDEIHALMNANSWEDAYRAAWCIIHEDENRSFLSDDDARRACARLFPWTLKNEALCNAINDELKAAKKS